MNSSPAVKPTDGTTPKMVCLILPNELWVYLETVSEGRGQSMDAMLSERIVEFHEAYNFI